MGSSSSGVNSSAATLNTEDASDEFEDADEEPQSKSLLRHKVSQVGRSAKQKSRRVIGSLTARSEDWQENDDPKDSIRQNPAFNPSKLVPPKEVSVGSTTDKILGTARAVGKAVIQPKTVARRKAASKIAIKDRPYLSLQADEEYLEAHADLDDAAAVDSSDGDVEASVIASRRRIKQMEHTRDARKVAWITSRHISRIHVIEKKLPDPPHPDAFYVINPEKDARRFDWQAFSFACARHQLKCFAIQRMGEIDDQPPQAFDKDTCLKYVERILIATSPWQSCLLSVRSIYRWEDPKKTMKWAIIWFVIWWQDYVVTFIYCWIVYIVLDNRFRAKKADHLKESYDRARNEGKRAFRFNELIERHGSGKWLDPLIEEAGPVAQMQLADTADFLEVLVNFYDWRYATKTWGTLFWLFCATSVGVIAPAGFSLKILWMFCLLAVFASRPIASRHRQYRHAVNAFKWIFWNIPTDAEWGMAYLRQQSQETKKEILELPSNQPSLPQDTPEVDDTFYSAQETPHPKDDSDDLMSHSPDVILQSFHVRWTAFPCRLLILPDGLQLRAATPLKADRVPLRYIPWEEVREIRKTDGSATSKMMRQSSIDIVVNRAVPRIRRDPEDGGPTYNVPKEERDRALSGRNEHYAPRRQRRSIVRLDGLKNRDLVFNAILGFSGLCFRVLQPVTPANTHSRGGVPDDGEGIDEDNDHGNNDARSVQTDDQASLEDSNNDDDDDDDDGNHDSGGRGIGRKAGDAIAKGVHKVEDKVKRLSRRVDDGLHGREQLDSHSKDDAGDAGPRKERYDPYQVFRKDSFWDGWFA